MTMKNYFKSAIYAFLNLVGMILEIPAAIVFTIAELFFVEPVEFDESDENNEEENDEE